MILFSVGTFTGSIAVGAASFVTGLVAALVLAAATALVVIEYRDRRLLAIAEDSAWEAPPDDDADTHRYE